MPRESVMRRAAPGSKPPATPPADKISVEEFRSNLALYSAYIKPKSDSKNTKPGERSLSELDSWRYGDAIADFSGKQPQRQMELDDVKTLVQWKLKHGKFRPTLMKLVSSNDAAFVRETMQEGSKFYWDQGDVSGALKILTKLKGIGPATASLLLAVLDPDRVVFFADEAFHWLCCDGKQNDIKYNAREYDDLTEQARKLCKRLDVRAVDVERVAYVMMQPQGLPDGDTAAEKSAERDQERDQEPDQGQKRVEVESSRKVPAQHKQAQTPRPAKRKARSDEEAEAEGKEPKPAPGRRSKRIQNAKEA